jgi:uncharacterized OB-fold protein
MTDDLVTRFATGRLSAEFWQGLAEGRLLIPFCESCGRHFFFPRRWCPSCWSDRVRFDAVPGTGEIFAISELHTAFQGVTEKDLPVAIVLVQLDEGVRIPGRLARRSMPARIGDRVHIEFAVNPATSLPEFVTS